MNNDIPTGWVCARLADIAEINPRHPRDLKDSTKVSFAPMAALAEEQAAFQYLEERKLGEVRKGFTHFAEGDVLFAKITPCMENGKGAVATGLLNGLGCGTTEIHVIRPHAGVDPLFLFRFLQQRSFRNEAKANFTGTAGQARVPTLFIQDAEIPLPSLPEQRRIVAKLEELLRKVAVCQKRLDHVPALLKRFRQAVLESATNGSLTAEWRSVNSPTNEDSGILIKDIGRDRAIKGDTRRNLSNLPPIVRSDIDLPSSWTWASPSQLRGVEEYSLAIGPFGSNLKVSDYREKGIPLIFVRNIRSRDFGGERSRFVSTEKARELKPHWVMPGDILITKMGEPPGDACLYPDNLTTGIITADCIKFRPHLSLWQAREYFVHAINSSIVKSQVRMITMGVAQQKMSLERFATLAIPLPPLSEQLVIVQRVNALLSVAEAIERRLTSASAYVELLSQSILAKAFRGELVPQVPEDQRIAEAGVKTSSEA